LTVVGTLLAFVVAEAVLAQPDALQHPTSLSQTPNVELKRIRKISLTPKLRTHQLPKKYHFHHMLDLYEYTPNTSDTPAPSCMTSHEYRKKNKA
jgi:hypothetical protein